MIQAAHSEIRRLTRLRQGTELQLLLLAESAAPTPAELARVTELEQRARQLDDRIRWFETILREHDIAAE